MASAKPRGHVLRANTAEVDNVVTTAILDHLGCPAHGCFRLDSEMARRQSVLECSSPARSAEFATRVEQQHQSAPALPFAQARHIPRMETNRTWRRKQPPIQAATDAYRQHGGAVSTSKFSDVNKSTVHSHCDPRSVSHIRCIEYGRTARHPLHTAVHGSGWPGRIPERMEQ